MTNTHYQPMIELTRGRIVESVHAGAVAVVDASGRLVASFGSPDAVTFMRSSSKPFQALLFVESGAAQAYGLTDRELAVMCASHSGTDEHVAVVAGIQRKTGVSEAELKCGVHQPYHEETLHRMIRTGEQPTPNRHNCSGKHTGMLAFVHLRKENVGDYLDFNHPLQRDILTAFAQMCGLDENQVELGIDGCSAPNFAVPLRHAALAYARLGDPTGLPDRRANALNRLARAMTTNPDMVGGPARFDTDLMSLTGGMIVSKTGAEGYQGAALLPGALGAGSPALGIAAKIADGDQPGRARSAVIIEVLRQLGALTAAQVEALGDHGAHPLYNLRHLPIGELRPTFTLRRER